MDRATVLKKWSEAPLTAENNYVNGRRTDLIAVHNAGVPGEQLAEGAGWTPELRTTVHHPGPSPCWSASGRGGQGVRPPMTGAYPR